MNDPNKDTLWEVSKRVYKELDVLLSYFPKIAKKQDKEMLLVSAKQIPIYILKDRTMPDDSEDRKYLLNASLASQTLTTTLTEVFNSESNNVFYLKVLQRIAHIKNQLVLEIQKYHKAGTND